MHASSDNNADKVSLSVGVFFLDKGNISCYKWFVCSIEKQCHVIIGRP